VDHLPDFRAELGPTQQLTICTHEVLVVKFILQLYHHSSEFCMFERGYQGADIEWNYSGVENQREVVLILLFSFSSCCHAVQHDFGAITVADVFHLLV
jgi:hypothetical protein